MDTFGIENNKVIYNGIRYDFDKLPENVVFDGDINLYIKKLSRLPKMSTWIIKGDFNCSHNNLTSLKGCPKKIGWSFNCYGNNLKSLEGCPKEVGGWFGCSSNKLSSLEHCPRKVGDFFSCSCNHIKTIDAWPEYIGDNYYIDNNPITSIKEGILPLKYLIEFYKNGWFNSKELLMKELGCDTEEELNAYLIMMEKI